MTSKFKRVRRDRAMIAEDPHYFRALDRLLDDLFQLAADNEWTWSDLAIQSGLSITTIHNLGMRHSKRPQFRSVWKIADALGAGMVLKRLRKVRLAKVA